MDAPSLKRSKKPKVSVTLRVDPELRDELKKIAREKGEDFSYVGCEFWRWAVNNYRAWEKETGGGRKRGSK